MYVFGGHVPCNSQLLTVQHSFSCQLSRAAQPAKPAFYACLWLLLLSRIEPS